MGASPGYWLGEIIKIRTMVQVIQKSNKKLYQCDECGFHYQDKEIAEKCEAWCKEHKSCNIEIIAHAEENKPEVNN